MNFKKHLTLVLVLTSVVLGHKVRAQETWNVNYNSYGSRNGSPAGSALLTGGIDITGTRTGGGTFSVLAYCVDRYSDVYVPGSYSVQTTTDPAGVQAAGHFNPDQGGVDWLHNNSTAAATALWGRVSWIYDNYGQNAGTNHSDQAFATQLAIWNVLGETSPTLTPSDYGAGVAADYANILSTSVGKTASAYFLARTPGRGQGGQAFIGIPLTPVGGGGGPVTPEGSSLLLILSGGLPFMIVPLRNRLRRLKA